MWSGPADHPDAPDGPSASASVLSEKPAGVVLVLLCCQGMLATITIYITVLQACPPLGPPSASAGTARRSLARPAPSRPA